MTLLQYRMMGWIHYGKGKDISIIGSVKKESRMVGIHASCHTRLHQCRSLVSLSTLFAAQSQPFVTSPMPALEQQQKHNAYDIHDWKQLAVYSFLTTGSMNKAW